MRQKRLRRVRLCVLTTLPITAPALITPLRVTAPQIVRGVHCYDGGVCTDDREKLAEAQALFAAALARAFRCMASAELNEGIFAGRGQGRIKRCNTGFPLPRLVSGIMHATL